MLNQLIQDYYYVKYRGLALAMQSPDNILIILIISKVSEVKTLLLG